MNIEIKVLPHGLGLPKYAREGDACFDLQACFDITLHPNSSAIKVHTGIAIHIKDDRYVGLIYSRSSIGHNDGIYLSNCVGVIDSGYQGEILVSMRNNGGQSIRIHKGFRIAQMMIVPVMRAHFIQVEEFGIKSKRGEDGFGSTGL